MYMETTVFILCILLGLAILSMGVITCLQVVVGSRERKELQKLLKARDLPEFTTYAQKPEADEIEDTSNLVELEEYGFGYTGSDREECKVEDMRILNL